MPACWPLRSHATTTPAMISASGGADKIVQVPRITELWRERAELQRRRQCSDHDARELLSMLGPKASQGARIIEVRPALLVWKAAMPAGTSHRLCAALGVKPRRRMKRREARWLAVLRIRLHRSTGRQGTLSGRATHAKDGSAANAALLDVGPRTKPLKTMRSLSASTRRLNRTPGE